MTNKDKQKIRGIIQEFSSVYSEMESIEKELINLEKRRSEAIDKVREIRDREKALLLEMKEKYGDVTLDLEKMEIVK
jgi:hypothetical protein